MKFKTGMTSIGKLLKKKEYEFILSDEQIENIKKSNYENPIVLTNTVIDSKLAYFDERTQSIHIRYMLSFTVFEEIKQQKKD